MERTVLVTGAGSGFGLASALELAHLGFSVVGVVPTEAESEALDRAARNAEVPVEIVALDLRDVPARASLVAGRPLFGLVNNAGYMNAGLLRDVPLNEARKQIEAMVLAPIDLALQALPYMLDHGEGRILNVTSAASHTTTPLTGWYQACKAALRELNDAMRLELQGTGVDVIDLEPGAHKTAIWERARGELRRHREGSSRGDAYEHALRWIGRLEAHASEPARVGREVGRLMTVGSPPAHRRIGIDAPLMKIAAEALPARLFDRIISRASTGRSG